jgi:tetratricopeptide (TPR) repeat protein
MAATPHLAWASPALSGSYEAGSLGRLELSTQEDGRLVGRLVGGGGACNFPASEPVLEGRFQDNVLVGKVTLCLTGSACQPRKALDLLAFYTPESKKLAAQVRLPPGCGSPALTSGSLLRLNPVSDRDALPGQRPPPASAEGAPRGSDNAPRDEGRAAVEFSLGNDLLKKKDWKGAEQHFVRSIEYNDRNWLAYYSLAIALVNQDRKPEAEQALNKAGTLTSESHNLYLLACAFGRLGDKQRAMESLRRAVTAGYWLSKEDIFADEYLQRLLLSEPEFLELARRARANPPPKKRR